jgi:hypothetical protein
MGIVRLFLIVGMLLAPLAGPRAAVDPALAMAMAAGSLCLGDRDGGLPAEGHEQCLACQAVGGWAGLVPGAVAMGPARAAPPAWRPGRRADADFGWPAYASRAPPGGVG